MDDLQNNFYGICPFCETYIILYLLTNKSIHVRTDNSICYDYWKIDQQPSTLSPCKNSPLSSGHMISWHRFQCYPSLQGTCTPYQRTSVLSIFQSIYCSWAWIVLFHTCFSLPSKVGNNPLKVKMTMSFVFADGLMTRIGSFLLYSCHLFHEVEL